MHEAEVALLDQVEERQAGRLVLLGDRHDQAEVRLHEGALGVLAVAGLAAQLPLAGRGQVAAGPLEVHASLVAALDRLGQPDLVVLGEQRVLPDVGEVEADEIFLVALDTLFGQERPLCSKSDCGRYGGNACDGEWSARQATRPSHGPSCGPYDTGLVKSANLLVLMQTSRSRCVFCDTQLDGLSCPIVLFARVRSRRS